MTGRQELIEHFPEQTFHQGPNRMMGNVRPDELW